VTFKKIQLLRVLANALQGSPERWGFHPKHDVFSAHPTVSSELLARIGVGRVNVHPNIARIEEKHVVFEDGERVPCDVIMYCTGYKVMCVVYS